MGEGLIRFVDSLLLLLLNDMDFIYLYIIDRYGME